jgi:hypothetical protein
MLAGKVLHSKSQNYATTEHRTLSRKCNKYAVPHGLWHNYTVG